MKCIRSRKNINYLLLIICIVQIVIGVYFITQKVGFHVDEISTYGLANDESGGWIEIPHAQVVSSSLLKEFVSVDEEHRFHYENVWENQKNDVHPPLYYALIHTISSVFPNGFSKFMGTGLNLVLSIAITILLYAITRQLARGREENSIVLLAPSAIWAFSYGNMNQVTFIRMYLLLATLMLSSLLLHIYYNSKIKDGKFYTLLMISSTMGALTQYYYVVFLFFLCLPYGINFLLKKKWQEAAKYVCSLVVAGILSILCFPAMLQHIFLGGYRGKETFQNLSDFSNFIARLKWFFKSINHQLFNGSLEILVVMILILILIASYKNKNSKKLLEFIFENRQFTLIGILLFSCMGYYVMIAKITVMVEDRYIMPIYPMVILILCEILAFFPVIWVKFKPKYAYLLVFLISLSGLYMNEMGYLYRDSLEGLEYAKENREETALVICRHPARMHTVFEELLNYKNIILIAPEEVELLKENGLDYFEELTVYEIINDMDDYHKIDMKEILDRNPRMEHSQLAVKRYVENNLTTVNVYQLN